jgi:glycosyltransferase involved in cell wall biosynthesis
MTLSPPLRVLLWSPQGLSEQSHEPSSFAHRLYSLVDPGEVQVSLAHAGEPATPNVPFQAQHQFPGSGGLWSNLSFFRHTRSWITANASRFDVFHGLTACDRTVQPAYDARQHGLPAVVTVASHHEELVDEPGLRGILGGARKRRELLRQLDAVIAMNSLVHEELRECGLTDRQIARIPGSVNANRFRPVDSRVEQQAVRRALGLSDRPTVLYSGSLTRRNRPHLLVQAVAWLKRHAVDCQLVLVGPSAEPEYTSELRAQIVAEGVDDRVRCFPAAYDVERYYQAADVFALPATGAGTYSALIEAMSCGLACIGTQLAGIADVIDDGTTGFIIEPTVESIADALNEYLTHPDLIVEHGQLSRARTLQRYSTEAVRDAYLELFRCVIAGRDACEASTLPASR